ncbi:MAG: Hsp70 family protein [Polyangiaceae bacterium]
MALLGIDIGTSTIRAAMVPRRGRPEPTDVVSVPAIASFRDGRLAVGGSVLMMAGAVDDVVVTGLKRVLGRRPDDPMVQRICERHHLHARPHGGYDLELYRPEAPDEFGLSACQALASLLRHAAEAATGTRGGHEAVFAVPGWFGAEQRDAVVAAAHLAQIAVLRFVRDTVAGALWASQQLELSGRVVVVDAGAGGISVSLLRLNRDRLLHERSRSSGEQGGDDVDAALAATVLDDPDRRARELARQSAEILKRELGEQEAARRVVRLPNGRAVTLAIERWELGLFVTPLVRLFGALASRLAEETHVDTARLGGVLALGGSSAIAALESEIQSHFDSPRGGLDAERSVALGAALQAAAEKGRGVGVELQDGEQALPPVDVGARELRPTPVVAPTAASRLHGEVKRLRKPVDRHRPAVTRTRRSSLDPPTPRPHRASDEPEPASDQPTTQPSAGSDDASLDVSAETSDPPKSLETHEPIAAASARRSEPGACEVEPPSDAPATPKTVPPPRPRAPSRPRASEPPTELEVPRASEPPPEPSPPSPEAPPASPPEPARPRGATTPGVGPLPDELAAVRAAIEARIGNVNTPMNATLVPSFGGNVRLGGDSVADELRAAKAALESYPPKPVSEPPFGDAPVGDAPVGDAPMGDRPVGDGSLSPRHAAAFATLQGTGSELTQALRRHTAIGVAAAGGKKGGSGPVIRISTPPTERARRMTIPAASLPRHGTLHVPESARELLALAITRPLLPEDLEPIAPVVLLRRLLGRRSVSGTLRLELPDGALDIDIEGGAAWLDLEERSRFAEALDVDGVAWSLEDERSPRKGRDLYPLPRFALEALRRRLGSCGSEELAAALDGHLTRVPHLRDDRESLPAKLGLEGRQHRLAMALRDNTLATRALAEASDLEPARVYRTILLLELFECLRWGPAPPPDASELNRRADPIQSDTHFAALEISSQASDDEVRESFARLYARYAEDSPLAEVDARACARIRARLIEAREVLEDPELREAYRELFLDDDI